MRTLRLTSARFRFIPLLLAVLCIAAATPLHARPQPSRPHPSAQPAGNGNSTAEKADAPETNRQIEEFRHSPAVQSLARHLHLSTDTLADILEDLNSGILIVAILWVIFRLVPKIFRTRSQSLQKQLFDARLATTEASERLSVVEERLSKLGIEIDAIREQTEHDSIADEQRIHESLQAEKQRIIAAAEREIEASGAAARRDLKKYAADLALDRAMSEIHLTPDDDRRLIRTFGSELQDPKLRGERN
jgi:F-type H+-transporting ATPase subunit b